MMEKAHTSTRTSTQVPKVIAFTSGKGGVGKTSVAVNLAVLLSRMKRKVLLFDADLGLANVNVMLGIQPAATIDDVLKGDALAADIIVPYARNMHVIPAGSGVQALTRMSSAERILLVEQLEEVGQHYDYILLDTGAGIGDNVLYFAASAEEIYVVVNQEPTSITDAYAIIKVLAADHGQKRFHILVNRVRKGENPKATYAKLAAVSDKFLNVSLLFAGGISEDPALGKSVIAQEPLVLNSPAAAASKDLAQLAQRIEEQKKGRSPSGSMQLFFKELLNRAPSTDA